MKKLALTCNTIILYEFFSASSRSASTTILTLGNATTSQHSNDGICFRAPQDINDSNNFHFLQTIWYKNLNKKTTEEC